MKEYAINAKELKVIELLNRKKFCTANEIAENLGVTSRTILNYIKNINKIIGKEVAEIKFTKNKKYIIKKINVEKFDIITNAYRKSNISFPEERIIEIIKILLEERKMIKIEDLAEMFYISRTTLIKDLKRISNILKNYNIELRGKPNSGIEAFGNEMNIRFCLSQIFYKRDNGIYKKSQKQHGCSFNDVANTITFYASDKANYLTGQSVNITGGQVMH
ncbi:HTH domain-containing protein [Abyssisolibacter fermentans]|uniref:HTH domain-containing protein n=1 Tax=Abyssisolibacter fermentans TaxID=1766203 RepID=UPI0008310315|nr:HTH domain-containing protein [Abyssisolibacter fermentans]